MPIRAAEAALGTDRRPPTRSGRRHALRTPASLAPLLLLSVFLLPARADDWKDGRNDRHDRAVAALEEAARAAARPTGVALRHGDVRVVADLARVDVVLEIKNTTRTRTEWSRSFGIDDAAELIGAALERATGPRVAAQTMTLESARRMYGEITRPPPVRRSTPWPRRDPLRVERPSDGRLDVVVTPLDPGEVVRVHLDFVTPLRGRGARRAYRDVIDADLGSEVASRRATPTAPDRAPAPRSPLLLSIETDWLVRPGGLTVDAAPIGMVAAGSAGGVLRFVGASAGPADVPTLPFRTPREDAGAGAIAVPGGGLLSRVVVWRFDPRAFLAAHDLEAPAGATLRLLRRTGSTSRIAPFTFGPADAPLPVTARLGAGAQTLRYGVEVRDAAGKTIRTIEVEAPVEEPSLSPDLEGAILGWHRAALVRRVLAWAKGAPEREARALAFAVDEGVLVGGTAGLAVPEAELRAAPRRSRSEYRHDGSPLGAQHGEADFKGPPWGSLDD